MGSSFRPPAFGLIVLTVLGWAYWPTAQELWKKWASDPQYSHGMLVPLFSLSLLYRSRSRFRESQSWPVIGVAVLLSALALRVVGVWTSILTLDGLSLVLSVLGMVLVGGGWGWLRAAWPAVFFLLFMVPLPYSLERMLGAQLQQIATIASTFLLRCCGLPALAEGNLILIEDVRLGVVEACSGLRMLVTFAAFCVGAAFVIERVWVVKAIVLLSTVPIAVLTNVLRITATGLAHVWLKNNSHKTEVLDFLHDFNGWMMMPVGLAFLLWELWVLKHLLLEPPAKNTLTKPTPAPYVPRPAPVGVEATPVARKPVRIRVRSGGVPPVPTPEPVAGPTPRPIPGLPQPAVTPRPAPLPISREAFQWRG